MKPTEQTTQQIERFINKIAHKFPENEDPSLLTDIHIIVSQDSGEMLAFDDDEVEITRCIVEQWIDNKDDDFYDQITKIFRSILHDNSKIVDKFGILKPYSFVLENDDNENIAELYLADDETVILGGDLMEGLNQDLDDFLDNLIKERD